MGNEFNVPRRRWGKSNIEIPVIPFGTQGFGNNFGFVSDDDACALIRRAVDIGERGRGRGISSRRRHKKAGRGVEDMSRQLCAAIYMLRNGTAFDEEKFLKR